MRRRQTLVAAAAAWAGMILVHTTALPAAHAGTMPAVQGGWTIPAGAAEEKNPLTVNAAVLAAGQKVFASKCQRCHGPNARGDGPDADKAHRQHMDLTNAAHAASNPDGVVFHKLWNGRSSPRMPSFKDELSREQAWAVVAYVQSLRGKQ